jgi:hypothetical protein
MVNSDSKFGLLQKLQRLDFLKIMIQKMVTITVGPENFRRTYKNPLFYENVIPL